VASDLQLKSTKDWKKVTVDSILKRGGSFINSHYGGSLVRGLIFPFCSKRSALRTVYPGQQFDEPVKSKKLKPLKYWNNVQNQRRFLDDLAVKLNIKSPEDWYSVKVETVVKLGGTFITRHYDGSLVRGKKKCIYKVTFLALASVYPEHKWNATKTHKPSKYWKDINSQRNYFDNLAVKFRIHEPSDWYSMSTAVVKKMGGTFISRSYGGSLLKGTTSTIFSE
jgi:hypothetical protein